MEMEKRPDGYWIREVPDGPDCGPDDRKADAESDRSGMARFLLTQVSITDWRVLSRTPLLPVLRRPLPGAGLFNRRSQ